MAKTKNEVNFDFNLTVKVDLDSLPGDVEIDRDAVAEMVKSAISEYCSDMAEAVSLSGDWNDNGEAVASTTPEIEIK